MRRGVWAVALIAALAGPPEPLLARSIATGEIVALASTRHLSRLAELRESLTHRQAQARELAREAARRTQGIGDLRQRRVALEAELRHSRERAAELERRLDRLVPRSLARIAALRQHRQQAARAIAELATLSRSVALDDATRARLLAISPLMLERLGTAEAGLSALRSEPERTIARHRDLVRRIPELLAERDSLQARLDDQRRAQDRADSRLAALRSEIERVSQEQSRLAERVLGIEIAHAVSAAPRAAAWAGVAVSRRFGQAAVEGRVDDARQVARGIDALHLASSEAIARISPRLAGRLAYEIAPGAGPTVAARWRAPRDVAIKGDLATEMPGASRSANDAIPLDAGWPRPVELGRGSARVLLARLEPADEPIMPLATPRPDAFGVIGGELDQPGMIIVALPGQAVVAPTDGRVVFAGPFRSYGLLLIIEQEREYHTLLWGFSRLEVETGDTVRAGQIVGIMAADGNPDPKLHVELRRNGQPVSPSLWLAGSNSKVRG